MSRGERIGKEGFEGSFFHCFFFILSFFLVVSCHVIVVVVV